MEDKNINPQQPDELFDPIADMTGEIPVDMPQFDLNVFSGETDIPEEPPLVNLFPEQPLSDPAEAPEVAEELPREPVPEEFVPEEPVVPAAPEVEPTAEEAPVDAPMEAEPFAEPVPVALPVEPLPVKDFSAFDIPMDEVPETSIPEEVPCAAPVDVYPPEDDSSYAAEAPTPFFPEADPAPYAEVDPLIFSDESGESAFTGESPEPVFDDDREFADLFEGNAADTAESAPAKPTRPVRKGRPKRKKGDGLLGLPHLLATLIWLGIIVLIGVSLGRMLWVCAADVLAFGREDKEVVVTIGKDDTIEDIARILHEKGLINYPGVFELYASIAVDEGEISPGTYTLNTILDYHALVGQMSSSSSSRAVVEDVLIPEGYNCRQIFELLEQNGICTVEELEEYAASGEFQDFWFLEGLERGDKYCLEGYLFPDTYDFYAGSTPREALGKMLLGFEARFTEELYSQLPALNERLSAMMRQNGCSQEFIDSHQLGLHELLTVASLIEEETASSAESPSIASVIYNRLTQDQEYERYLGIDAAIIYATGDAENIDTSIDHPYNTYINAGLTPGPISNPGLSSINAALNFLDTDYYYYVLNPSTGEHQFSKTYEEHQEWIEKFREMEPTEG